MSEVLTAQPTRNLRRELLLLLVALGLLAVAGGISDASFNNFLNDTYHITAAARGQLEFPRELPGFLVALLGGALYFLSVIRLGAFAATCLAGGFFGLAFLGNHNYATMVAFTLLWSTGSHLMMPVSTSLQLSLAPKGKRAGRLGQIGGILLAAAILGNGLVFVWFRWVGRSGHAQLAAKYHLVFLLAGALAVLGALAVTACTHPTASRVPSSC